MTNISKIFEGYFKFYSNGQASPPASRQATLERKVNWQKVQGASQLIKHNMAIMMPSLKEKEIAKFKSIHWKRRTFSGWLWAQAMAMGMATVSGNICSFGQLVRIRSDIQQFIVLPKETKKYIWEIFFPAFVRSVSGREFSRGREGRELSSFPPPRTPLTSIHNSLDGQVKPLIWIKMFKNWCLQLFMALWKLTWQESKWRCFSLADTASGQCRSRSFPAVQV